MIYKCERCEGTGVYVHNHEDDKYTTICRQCDGAGELDWIDNIYGTHFNNRRYLWGTKTLNSKSRKLKAGWTMELKEDLKTYEKAADQIAKDIDDSILDALRYEI